jgi:methionyl-tRNA synthetase
VRTVKDTFYITTPIYYVNDVPHLGHAYTTVAADFVARYQRIRGRKVFYLTGTDEHGQKVARAAEERGKDPQSWTDEIVPRWREVWQLLDISHDDFIRTTEERHTGPVQKLAQTLWDNGHVYLDRYEGPYCVSCETFYQELELVEGNCPIHGIPVERFTEENYFFRLSAFQDKLLRHYESHPEFVQPEERRNEVMSFVKGGLQDLSISRTSFTWGVPVPWDPKHVIYVWIDALPNYITAVGYGSDEERFDHLWPADYHFIGKDILRHHAVIWPAVLMAADIPLPETVFAHGFLTVGGEKMSKTKLTGIHPKELVEHFGVDAYRYHFLRDVQFGQDGSFSWESMVARYNADLANGLGNLASRVLAMLDSYFGGKVPAPGDAPEPMAGVQALGGASEEAATRYEERMLSLDLAGGLAAVWGFVGAVNRYLVETAPWAVAKDDTRRGELALILYAAAEALRIIAVFLSPAMPRAAAKLWEQLGLAEPLESQRLPDAAAWGRLPPGTRTRRGKSLFPRLEG